MRNMSLGWVSLVALVVANSAAQAAVVTFSDRAIFESQGTIAFNSNFSDFGTGGDDPGTPFTRGGVTYTSDENFVLGTDSGYVENVMVNNLYSPLTGTIDPIYNMFGFDLGYIEFETPNNHLIDLKLTTNLGTYTLTGLSPPDAMLGLDFYGFIANGAGEYFTGFELSAQYANDSEAAVGPAMTNVDVGTVTLVPEPATITLWGLFLAGAGLPAFIRRGRRPTCNSRCNERFAD